MESEKALEPNPETPVQPHRLRFQIREEDIYGDEEKRNRWLDEYPARMKARVRELLNLS